MILAIIQARMGSTRFRNKMVCSLADKPLVEHVINRIKKSKLIDNIALATTINKEDDILLRKAQELGIDNFAGSEDDVLDRFYQCAKKFNATIVIRICGDCPLMDPKVIDEVINLFNSKDVDYASNIHPPTYPDGLDVEV